MDKRFEKVIKKMDKQTDTEVELQNQVSSLFKDIKNTQNDIDTKVDKVNLELERTLNNFEKESEKVFNNIKSEFEKQKLTAYDVTTNVSDKLSSLQNEYLGKVKVLIKSIDEKSKEILKIYDELENIKKIQQEAANTFGEIADNQKKLISDFKEKTAKLISESDISSIIKIVESFQSRVAKLEKHAHQHTFGGSKV